MPALEWAGGYGVTNEDLLKVNALWSNKYNGLIFPLFLEDQLVMYSIRYFTGGLKSRSFGSLKSNYILPSRNRTCVIVEDVISGITIHKSGYSCLVLFGSYNPKEKIASLNYDKYILWLDADKAKEGITYTRGVRNMQQVITVEDPKKYSIRGVQDTLANISF